MTIPLTSHLRRSGLRSLLARLGAGFAFGVVLMQTAAAQGFPNRPVTIVVPYPAGGTTDVLARVMQEPLAKLLGQSVIIDNKPGASGMLAARLVAKAPADGYTLVMPNNGLVISPHVTRDPGYAPLKDFAPITTLSLQPMVMVATPSLPVQTLQQLIDYAKANPGKVEFATAGPASFGHLATELFAQRAGIKLTHIPYKGQAPATQAVLTGEVKILLSTTTSQLNQFIKEGRAKLLGVASLQPSPLAPGAVPMTNTLKNFEAEVWFGLLAPAGTPREAIAKINEAMTKVLAMPEVQAKFEATGAMAAPSTPEAFAARLADESASWGTIVREANIKAE
jgi:tripartite-type tricarboxylate transporter receptor subunit TctC